MDTMEMTTETTDRHSPSTGIPSSYALTARPAASRRPSNVNPRLLADLEATLGMGDALCFGTDGMDDKAVNRTAARLNAIGRRAGSTFTVRTRHAGGHLYAWAVAKQAVRARAAKKPAAAAV